ncbi:MAG: hypothetical protein IT582_01000 [Opitutaceae bacterium]|nr:hypothetical protein [Opitutaceae bacterium]
MSGYTAGELTAAAHGLLHVEAEDRNRLTQWLKSGATETPLAGESSLRRQDGTMIQTSWNYTLLRGTGQKPAHLVGVYRDTTDRRGWQKTQDSAQRLEAVGRMAAGAAHDFNNLISVINGFCEILAPMLESHPQALYEVRQIHQTGLKAAALTRQLLAIGHQQPFAARVLELNQFVRDNTPALHRLLGGAGQLEIELSDAACGVETDPGQLQQVLFNLVLNARDALRDRGLVTVRVGRRQISAQRSRRATDPAPGDYAVLTVADNGTGMEQETQERLFEPFFTTKPEGKGSGLGLALVYGVVQQSKGSISVRSELLVGSTF